MGKESIIRNKKRMMSDIGKSIIHRQHPAGNLKSIINKVWYAVYTRSRHEKTVSELLTEIGIVNYLPLVQRIRQWSDRKKKVMEPLFRGYVFVNINLKKEKLNVLQTHGLVKFISFGNKPAQVSDKDMYWITRIEEEKVSIDPEQYPSVGEKIKVSYGPFKGLDGIVKHINGKEKFIVQFDSIMQGVSVHIKPEYLVKSEKQKGLYQNTNRFSI